MKVAVRFLLRGATLRYSVCFRFSRAKRSEQDDFNGFPSTLK